MEKRNFTSQERVMVVSTADGHGAFSGGRSGHVERLGEIVVFPSRSGVEETLITNFIDHFWLFSWDYLTVLP